eukprot:594762-Rhodomonas_salina.2
MHAQANANTARCNAYTAQYKRVGRAAIRDTSPHTATSKRTASSPIGAWPASRRELLVATWPGACAASGYALQEMKCHKKTTFSHTGCLAFDFAGQTLST